MTDTGIPPHEFPAADLIQDPGKFHSLVPPAKLAVFGDPIRHSRSPELHNAALRACGIDAQYIRIHVLAHELSASLRALSKAGFIGANLTLPHKIAAMQLLDHVDNRVRILGSINTLAVESDGSLKGYNTDGPGLVQAVHEEFQVDIRDLKILILGAGGGAGQAIAAQCILEGCDHLVLANRSITKVEILRQHLESHCPDRNQSIITCALDESSLARELPGIDLLINATSVGLKDSDLPVLPKSLISPHLMVYDTVYTSPSSDAKTHLLTDAAAQGARTANGLSMLLHQGALAFEIWFHRPAPLAVMRKGLG